ncbi:MAG: hypothetical protein ACO3JL_13190, partial [Myxococcota bacterium]
MMPPSRFAAQCGPTLLGVRRKPLAPGHDHLAPVGHHLLTLLAVEHSFGRIIVHAEQSGDIAASTPAQGASPLAPP